MKDTTFCLSVASGAPGVVQALAGVPAQWLSRGVDPPHSSVSDPDDSSSHGTCLVPATCSTLTGKQGAAFLRL